MIAVGRKYIRRVNGWSRAIELVTSYMGIYENPDSGVWYAVAWKDCKHRAAFKDPQTARKWCKTANKIFTGLPETNAEINRFNDMFCRRGWIVTRLLGDCQVWGERKDWEVAT